MIVPFGVSMRIGFSDPLGPGSSTIRLPASIGPEVRARSFSTRDAMSPPLKRVEKRLMVSRVSAPTTPSASRAQSRWKSVTAAWVRAPKVPSTRPA